MILFWGAGRLRRASSGTATDPAHRRIDQRSGAAPGIGSGGLSWTFELDDGQAAIDEVTDMIADNISQALQQRQLQQAAR